MPVMKTYRSSATNMVPNTGVRLGKIMLKNYGIYKDTAAVELSVDSQKTITVITGAHGRGKTTILDAVYWCLYGKFRSEKNPHDMCIINRDVLQSLNPGDEDETSVEIHLYEGDEPLYAIKRRVHFIKRHESSRLVRRNDVGGILPAGIEITPALEFVRRTKQSAKWDVCTELPCACDAILDVLPEYMSWYFLVDDELLGSFFDSDGKNKIRVGMEKISGLSVVGDAIRHIRETRDELLKDMDLKTESQSRHNISALARTIEKILGQHRDDLLERFRNTVADKTTEYFLRLTPHNPFSKVEIGSDCTVTVCDPESPSDPGRPPSVLGTGLTYCLAVSCIVAMRDIAEKNHFIVIDSMLGRIAHDASMNIVKNLPQFIPDMQITWLEPDSTYAGYVYDTENKRGSSSIRDVLKGSGNLWGEYMLTSHENPATNSRNTVITELNEWARKTKAS